MDGGILAYEQWRDDERSLIENKVETSGVDSAAIDELRARVPRILMAKLRQPADFMRTMRNKCPPMESFAGCSGASISGACGNVKMHSKVHIFRMRSYARSKNGLRLGSRCLCLAVC